MINSKMFAIDNNDFMDLTHESSKNTDIKISNCDKFNVKTINELPDYNLVLVNKEVCDSECEHVKYKQVIRKKRIPERSYLGLDPDGIFTVTENNLRTVTLGIYNNNFNKLDKDFIIVIDPNSGVNVIKYIGKVPCVFNVSYNVQAFIKFTVVVPSVNIVLAYVEIINSNGSSNIVEQSFCSDIDNIQTGIIPHVPINEVEFSKSFAVVLHKDDLLILHIRYSSILKSIAYPTPYIQLFESVIIPLNSISIHAV